MGDDLRRHSEGWREEIEEKIAKKSELMSRLPPWAIGAQSHWGPFEEIYKIHLRISPGVRKLGLESPSWDPPGQSSTPISLAGLSYFLVNILRPKMQEATGLTRAT